MKTTMRQRAREIIEEASKVYGDDLSGRERFLMKKIATCDKVIDILSGKNSYCDMCPFPRRYGGDSCDCYSCMYFAKGITTNPRLCGCDLIKDGTITINQAINGLRIFKSEMKKYLKEKQRCPGA